MRKKRFSNVLVNIICAVIFFGAAFYLLCHIEYIFADSTKKADYIEKNVINIYNLSPENNKKLVHYTGKIKTDEILNDGNISLNTPVLKRKVEMYQWKEHRRSGRSSGSRRYNYTKVWSDRELEINHSNAYYNPKMKMKNKTIRANKVSVGDFILDNSVIRRIIPSTTLYTLPERQGYKIQSEYYYSGNDYNSPEIGDYRISYKYVVPGSEVSIIAAQYNNLLYTFKNKKYSINMAMQGSVTTYEMVKKTFRDRTQQLLTLVRIIGFICMLGGIVYFARPKTPKLIILSIFGSLFTSIFLITIPWLTVRPIIAVPLFIISGAITILIVKKEHISIKTILDKLQNA